MLELNEHIINDTDTITHYHLQRLLARGGMSHVYLAHDMEKQHMVAIKLVHSDEGNFCTRFQREVKAIAKLHHDHILPAFDYGEEGEWCYMVMPYIEGGTLKQRLEQGPLSPEEAERLFTQLTAAVQFAHEYGILHRDIKPSNILLRDGEHIYLTDFGLVRHIEEESNITGTGYVIGTPEYMAPELVEHSATTSSDVYALGIVLYQMLTGRVPFKGSSPIGTCWKHIHEQPMPPSTLNTAISSATEAVILRALAKDPQDRFQSAHELALAYQNSLRTVSLSSANTLAIPVDSAPSKRPIPTHRASRLHPGAVALVALIMLFIIPTTLGFLLSRTYGYDHYNQAPTLLGAGGTFFNGQVSGKPPVHSTPPVKATQITTETPTPTNTLSRYAYPPTSTPSSGGSGHGGTSQGGNHSGDHPHKGNGGGNKGNGGGDKGNGGGGKGNGGDGGDSNNSLQSVATLS